MNEHQYQLFVYGSLRQGFGHPAFAYIGNHFRFVASGKVKGLLYDLGEYPAAVPSDAEHFITGELYAIQSPDEFGYAIAQLDDYEGINPEAGEALYRREFATIFTETGETTAWIYWFNGNVQGFPVVASGDMMEYLKRR